MMLKQLTPVRLLKNSFFEQVQEAEIKGSDIETLKALLGRGRSKQGMLEGDLQEGELEIGQVSALLDTILPAAQIVENIMEEYELCRKRIGNLATY